MKFGHLIKENMRIIFIEKSYTKHDGQIIKDIFGLIVKNKNRSGTTIIHRIFGTNSSFHVK